MPHLVIYYTPNLDHSPALAQLARIPQLCRTLADAMLAVRCENDQAIFPPGGVRVLAYPAAHAAVSDGTRDDAFVYMNLRIGLGRSADTHARVGQMLQSAAQRHFADLFARCTLGVTVQIDEGREVFDAKLSNIHPLYAKTL